MEFDAEVAGTRAVLKEEQDSHRETSTVTAPRLATVAWLCLLSAGGRSPRETLSAVKVPENRAIGSSLIDKPRSTVAEDRTPLNAVMRLVLAAAGAMIPSSIHALVVQSSSLDSTTSCHADVL